MAFTERRSQGSANRITIVEERHGTAGEIRNLLLRMDAFPTESQPANARTTEKLTRISKTLHLTSGYGQLSDSIFGWLKCLAVPSGL